MKLSKAQKQYIKDKRTIMDQREKDLRSFGNDLWKNQALCTELHRIGYQRMFFNHMIDLHNVEVDAEKDAQKALEAEVEKVMSQ